MRRFLELQGDSLTGGVVLRRYAPLRIVGKHPQSGMPLAAEFRIFWAGHEAILEHRYWADLVSVEEPAPTAAFKDIAKRVANPFFAMDIAKLQDGSWTIVELGDGQVAGLPDRSLAKDFYFRLSEAICS